MNRPVRPKEADAESLSDSALLEEIFSAGTELAEGYQQQWNAGVRLAQYEWQHSKHSFFLTILLSIVLGVVIAGLWGLINWAVALGLMSIDANYWVVIPSLFVLNLFASYVLWHTIKQTSSRIGFSRTWRVLKLSTPPEEEK
ncbi:hypothetical protein OE749_10800 [Aestuariibacter sp. AA17]|uniref:Uncharacterized protein n=1 Tax=Fluctibacter corallii TaxID=2984329 RepID=A0ABT3A922_9ALTE|nr:hypothetical protein [Aestuariibacter sp. AA17]MCV2885179.1 hypothetical protein [Aestuariibacter sp. AA17]